MTDIYIEIFTSPTCPHCPSAVRATKDLLASHPELLDKVSWTEVSTATAAGSRLAVSYGIHSVPTIVITNKRGEKGAFVGAPTQKTYLNMINEMMI